MKRTRQSYHLYFLSIKAKNGIKNHNLFEAALRRTDPIFSPTDSNSSKRRPALVLSDSKSFKIDKSILAMITSSSHQPWPLDVEIDDLGAAGLKAPSIIRMKLFTLDNSLVVKTIGKLAESDSEKISFNLVEVFGF